MRLTDPIDHHVAGTERQLKPNTSPHHLAIKAEKQQLGETPMTYDRTWKIEPVRPDQAMDHGGVPRREKKAIKPGTASITRPGAENRIRTPSKLCRHMARYRGTAHPLCFTDEVMEHEFLEGFKPVNINHTTAQQI